MCNIINMSSDNNLIKRVFIWCEFSCNPGSAGSGRQRESSCTRCARSQPGLNKTGQSLKPDWWRRVDSNCYFVPIYQGKARFAYTLPYTHDRLSKWFESLVHRPCRIGIGAVSRFPRASADTTRRP